MSALRARLALALAVGAGAALTSHAQSTEDVFHRANAAYEEGRYADAVEDYRSLLRYDVRDPVVEYNLGNAEFRVGNLGRAILHYERARRLDPLDSDVRANLEFARSHCVDRVEEAEPTTVLRWLHAAQDRAGPDRQAWAVVGLVWALGAALALGLARPGGWSPAHGWTLAALLLALAAVGGSWYATLQRTDGTRVAVVLEDVVEVLAGPGHNNSTLFKVHEGLTLRIRSEREEWLQVSLPNGLNGWIARDAVEEV